MRHQKIGVAIVLLASALSACDLEELAITPIEPVLTVELALGDRLPQSAEFSFDGDGEYRMWFSTQLRNGPGSSPNTHYLPISVQIFDANREIRFEETIEAEMTPNRVGNTIAKFESSGVAGENPHTLVLTLTASEEFLEFYEGFRVSLKREPKSPLFD